MDDIFQEVLTLSTIGDVDVLRPIALQSLSDLAREASPMVLRVSTSWEMSSTSVW